MTIQEIRDFFRNNYSHINMQGIENSTILDFMKQSYVAKWDTNPEKQMDMLYDHIVSQDLTDVEE